MPKKDRVNSALFLLLKKKLLFLFVDCLSNFSRDSKVSFQVHGYLAPGCNI